MFANSLRLKDTDMNAVVLALNDKFNIQFAPKLSEFLQQIKLPYTRANDKLYKLYLELSLLNELYNYLMPQAENIVDHAAKMTILPLANFDSIQFLIKEFYQTYLKRQMSFYEKSFFKSIFAGKNQTSSTEATPDAAKHIPLIVTLICPSMIYKSEKVAEILQAYSEKMIAADTKDNFEKLLKNFIEHYCKIIANKTKKRLHCLSTQLFERFHDHISHLKKITGHENLHLILSSLSALLLNSFGRVEEPLEDIIASIVNNNPQLLSKLFYSQIFPTIFELIDMEEQIIKEKAALKHRGDLTHHLKVFNLHEKASFNDVQLEYYKKLAQMQSFEATSLLDLELNAKTIWLLSESYDHLKAYFSKPKEEWQVELIQENKDIEMRAEGFKTQIKEKLNHLLSQKNLTPLENKFLEQVLKSWNEMSMIRTLISEDQLTFKQIVERKLAEFKELDRSDLNNEIFLIQVSSAQFVAQDKQMRQSAIANQHETNALRMQHNQ